MNRFLTPHKTVIVADGEKPSVNFLLRVFGQAHKLIALDGACHWLLDHDIVPDAVIGDLDSVDRRKLKDLHVIQSADQNSNDLEKGLNYCQEQGLDHITVCGAFGLRVDHLLTNLYVLKKFSRSLCINFIDENYVAFMCPKNEEISISALKGSFLSLFPLSDAVGPITTTGVDYPLIEETLSLHSRIGTLNRINADRATIFCKSDNLLVLTQGIS